MLEDTGGVRRVLATWVKGHATRADVRRGITTELDRIGNNCADKLASRGADQHLVLQPALARASEAQSAKRAHTMQHHAMLLNIAREWRGAVDELPWLYSRAVPDPFLPRPVPGSFARRVRARHS